VSGAGDRALHELAPEGEGRCASGCGQDVSALGAMGKSRGEERSAERRMQLTKALVQAAGRRGLVILSAGSTPT